VSLLSKLTDHQSRKVLSTIARSLGVFRRPEPLVLSEWMDMHFKLSSECSNDYAPWVTCPYQVFIANIISNDDIPVINVMKSARVGYSQIVRGAVGYLAEHKKRNQIIYSQKDSDADTFMKNYIESMVRDCRVMHPISPWLNKRHRDSTLDMKRFSNGKMVHSLGGNTAKNYREKTVDAVFYEELSAFPEDIDGEGSPPSLGDMRTFASCFPKSVRGATPRSLPGCIISNLSSTCDTLFKCNVPCPKCDEFQDLEFGTDLIQGLKWSGNDKFPSDAEFFKTHRIGYRCRYCCELSSQEDWNNRQAECVWKCERTGVSSKDGIQFLDGDGLEIDPPSEIGLHIWVGYSPYVTWENIRTKWVGIKGDRAKLKSFVNTVLGEPWSDFTTEETNADIMLRRRENYPAKCPRSAGVITMAVDTQDNRLEYEITLWVDDEESYSLRYGKLMGDPGKIDLWNDLERVVTTPILNPDGNGMDVSIVVIDSKGHYTDEVYKFCARRPLRYFPLNGLSTPGKPIVNFNPKPLRHGCYLVGVGTDTAKEVVSARLPMVGDGPGVIHHPVSDEYDLVYFEGVLSERAYRKLVKGRWVIAWDAQGRANEPFDLKVYNLVAIRLRQLVFGYDPANKPKVKKAPSGGVQIVKTESKLV